METHRNNASIGVRASSNFQRNPNIKNQKSAVYAALVEVGGAPRKKCAVYYKGHFLGAPRLRVGHPGVDRTIAMLFPYGTALQAVQYKSVDCQMELISYTKRATSLYGRAIS